MYQGINFKLSITSKEQAHVKCMFEGLIIETDLAVSRSASVDLNNWLVTSQM